MRDLSRPTQPCPAIQQLMAAETAARAKTAGPAVGLADAAGAPSALREHLATMIERLGPEIIALSWNLHAHPEIGFEEYHAMAAVAQLLRAHGVEPRLGVYGIPAGDRKSVV